MQPVITIDLVITLYKAETFLDEYLMECKDFCDWLGKESYFSTNLIFVDDGSPDRTLEVLEAWYKSNKI